MRTLKQINAVYEYIVNSHINERVKVMKLTSLMTEMERVFKIPMIRDEQWEKENRAVIALYRKISLSRYF